VKILDANGADIPALGLGTWQLRGEACIDMVKTALDTGYRHVDTAVMYENEAEVGAGIKAAGLAREEIFLTTKIWPTDIEEGTFQRTMESSLKRLDVDHVDLLLIHWPPQNSDIAGWAALLNEAAERGWTRNIGVSNFTIPLLDAFVERSERPIACNQVEHHPYIDQSRLKQACKRHGVAMIAYCPLYRGGALFRDEAVVAASQAHGKSPAQIVLRWHMQTENAGAIPKTATPSRLAENLDVFDFQLSDAQMAAIGALKRRNDRICDYEFSPEWDAA